MFILFITIAKIVHILQKTKWKSPFRDFPKTFRILPIVITQKPPLKGF